MKIYKYWVAEKQRIRIEGEEQEITCYDGSNISMDDAHLPARGPRKFASLDRWNE